jgi:cell division protein FtsL
MIEPIDKILSIICAIIVVAATIVFVSKLINSCVNKQIKKDNTTIEKTNYSNDSLRIELKHIDKDKNEKIIEVKGLNNDSTYKLFKRLIAE